MVSLTNFRSVSELNFAGRQVGPDHGGINNQPIFTGQSQQLPQFQLECQTETNKYHFNQQSTIDSKQTKLGSNKSEHFEIRWNNLTYQVEPKWYRQKWQALTGGSGSSASRLPGKTNILNSLNGSVRSGQVTAILGPSGAGKTSLLGCLTGKNKSGVSGSVQVISSRHEPMSICTIPQKGKWKNSGATSVEASLSQLH